VAEFTSAVLQLLVGRLLHVEQSFEVVELSGLVFELAGMSEVVGDCSVGAGNDVWGRVDEVVWAGALEGYSVLAHLDVELPESVLDVACLLVLEREDGLLDRAQGPLTYLNKGCLRVLEPDEEVFSILS
jgi:hypothetical protein